MIKIVEFHHPIDNPHEYQCRIIKYESFEKYANDLENGEAQYLGQYSLPRILNIEWDFNIFDNYVIVKYIHPINHLKIIHKAWIVNIDL